MIKDMESRSRRSLFVACVAVGCLLGNSAWGHWGQTDKLTADDGASGDWFGRSVSVSGDIVVVGAPRDDAVAPVSGSAYVFEVTAGEQLHRLIPDDGATGDEFGTCVSVNGDIIVVGAPYDDDAGSMSGSAYVFSAITGQQLHKLTADDAAAADWFGASVSVSGDTIVVGAYRDSDAGNDSGSAYVFDATTGEQLHKLTADDAAEDDQFGLHVSVSANTIAVGARYDDDAGSESGSAYVFDAITGEQLYKLTADDAAAGDWFGRSVSASGNTIVVGAYQDDDAGSASGSAYVFDATTGEQLYKLTADDAAVDDRFGYAVSTSGNTIVVGAYRDDDAGSDSGSAYVFNATTGEQLQKLTADDAAEDDEFGYSVSVSGNTIVVGAPWDDDTGGGSGSAYVFQRAPCPADFDGDGDVDTTDLLHLLARWGTPDGDVDGDGDTDTADLLALLAAWGGCPDLPCPWDFSGDGVVDDLDADMLVEHWGACPDPPEECPWDLNGDGVVDIYDMMELLDHYGPCP